MKNITAYIIVASVLVFACDPDVDIPGNEKVDSYSKVYMAQAEGGARKYTYGISDKPEHLTLGATYGGMDYPSGDVMINIDIDDQLVADYNSANGTSYPILPHEAYEVSGNEVKILSGEVSSSLIDVTISTQEGDMIPFEEYMMAAQITNVSEGVTLNTDLQTAYFILKYEPLIPRDAWQVVSLSTEEPAEGANGGLVSSTIDGNENTFWHSKWSGGEAPPPHWFILDMAEIYTLHGLSILTRQSDNSGKPKEIVVEISEDGDTWTEGGSYTLENTSDLQRVFFTTGFNKPARYFKVTVNSSYNAGYTHMAEIYAF
ncbi:BT_3987 domain-containing protein [Fulvivirga ligni]|uniref:BT_3987 domain-containing protein n=1 Tax=Fulvivirga ligni TaxID=2904246 RepID=UPI001F2EB91B|nr:DUF1735 domain-containing protein [Fulvivirga ligni]UII19622.1 DUF1735 domain-containing protein [Fulvivirga ligni]